MELLNTEILIYVLSGITAVLLVWNIFLSRRLSHLLRGSDGKSIETGIKKLHDEQASIRLFERQVSEYLTSVETRLSRSIQSVEAIRFNAFAGTGESGNQSFAVALLNEQGDGLLLSSLYGRDHMSVFSKPVKGRSSKYELSKEEKHVLSLASGALSDTHSKVPQTK